MQDIRAVNTSVEPVNGALNDNQASLFQQAIIKQKSGDWEGSRADFQSLLDANPLGIFKADVLNGLGYCELSLGNRHKAFDLLKEALEIQPDRWDIRLHQSQAAREIALSSDYNKYKDLAIELSKDAAKSSPDPNVWMVYANTCKMFGRHNEAIIALKNLLNLWPKNPSIPLCISTVYHEKGEDGLAEEWALKTLDLDPEQPEAHFALSAIYAKNGWNFKSILHHALKGMKSPTRGYLSKWNAALAQLATGDYAEGWKNYEVRHQCDSFMKDLAIAAKRFDKPQWHGQTGVKVHVQPEQGFGDLLQFCRYVPLLQELGNEVTLETHGQTYNLLKNSFPKVKVVPKAEDWPKTKGIDTDFDYHIPLMSLPYAFGTTLETIPKNIPYIHAETHKIDKWRSRIATLPGLKVGICWAGEKRYHEEGMYMHDETRSMPFEELKPLFDLEEISFVSLQMGKTGDVSRQVPAIHQFMDDVWDWSDTAAIVHHLDVVISVCTSVCHLAGGMGKRLFVMNKYDACWRWLMDRNDSPWYGNAKLFRQPTQGDWETVVSGVREALQHERDNQRT